MSAAEQIVADNGMRALTFRAVQLAADQSNKSAAAYHFGSREGLLEAVIADRMAAVDARRREMIDQLERSAEPLTARQAVHVLVQPIADETLRRPGSYYGRFLAQALLDPDLKGLVLKHLMAGSYRRVHERLMELSPAHGEGASFRTNSAGILALILLAAEEGSERTTGESGSRVADLIEMLVAMLAAPVASAHRSVARSAPVAPPH